MDTRRRRSTGSLKIDVSTAWPSHSTSRGSPTFSDKTFKRPSLRVRGANANLAFLAVSLIYDSVATGSWTHEWRRRTSLLPEHR